MDFLSASLNAGSDGRGANNFYDVGAPLNAGGHAKTAEAAVYATVANEDKTLYA